MQENNTSIASVIKPGQTTWYISIIFFVMITWIILFFGISSSFRGSQITTIMEDISKLETDIASISKDRKVLIANIIRNNKLRPSLNLGPIIREFRMAAIKSNVRLNGFSIANDTITTTLIATEWDSGVSPDPVATVIKMMRDYAEWKMNFTLEPIFSLAWDPSIRSTGIELHVLPSKIQ